MSQTQLNDLDNGDIIAARDVAPAGDVPAGALQSESDPVVFGLNRSVWIQIAIITTLFSALFWPNLRRLWDKTNPFYGEANWGHAVCIPVIGLYYLYVNREKLLHEGSSSQPTARQLGLRVWGMLAMAVALPLVLVYEEAHKIILPAAATGAVIVAAALAWSLMSRSVQRADQHSAGWFGGFIVVFGIAVFQYAIFPGQNDFMKDLGMVITLFGVVLALSGWSVMKVAWFPIAFLVCGLPWPGLVYSKVAGPLQQLAANVAVWTLQLTGVEASVGGTKISMIGGDGNYRTLNVAEACAGMRSLMTFISVAAAVAFLSSRPLWQKLVVVVSAVPIAISCNVMRVSGQGLLDRYVSHSLSENFAHQFVGLLMLVPAFLMILLVGWILDQIFVEQIDRRFVAIAPKVITRSTAPVASDLPPRSAPRTLAAIRGAGAPPPAQVQPAKPATAQAMPAAAPAKPLAAPAKPLAKPAPASPKPAAGPRRQAGDMRSIVPPPPSVRLASRAPAPRKRRDSNGDSNSQTEAG